MTTLTKWLEGKRIPPIKVDVERLAEYHAHNDLLNDLQADSPTLLSALEAEIRLKIHGELHDMFMTSDNPLEMNVLEKVQHHILSALPNLKQTHV